VPDRAFGLVRHIHLAFAQPLDQVARREIDDFDIVGLNRECCRAPFANPYPGNPGNDIVEAVDVLDIEGRKTRRSQRLYSSSTSDSVSGAGCRVVAVRQLINKHELRPALQDRIEIHLG